MKRIFIILIPAVFLLFAACKGAGKDEAPAEYLEEESVTYMQLPSNNAARFSDEDLVFDNVRFKMTPEEVKALLGEPDRDNTVAEEGRRLVREFEYNKEAGRSILVFWETEGELKLCGVDSNDPARAFMRGIKVGMASDDVRDRFYRDVNCLNANVMSEDNATILGKFLYGDRTLDRLEENGIKDKLEYGIINYNGNKDMENGEVILEYLHLEPPYKNGTAGYEDDYSQLMFYTDNDRRVTEICWYYYPEIQ